MNPPALPHRIDRRLHTLLALTLALVAATGCTRNHFTNQADAEVYQLLEEKAERLHVGPHNYSIAPPETSRLAFPWDPISPPRPPDDPVSHELMERVDHKRGWKHWDKYGVLADLENPTWYPALMGLAPQSESGAIVLDLPAAVRVARANSRGFQNNLETLYLSALDVTFERFRFDTQFFLSNTTEYLVQGRQRGGGQSRTFLGNDTNVAGRRLFTTGAELVVNLANSIVWQFSGSDSYSAVTLLDFTFFQPFLREAGKPRILERLTLAERTLLANVRTFERFQRGFYVQIAAGAPGTGNPTRRGGVFGGAGLSGFTGVGGGFGQVGRGLGGGTAGVGAGQAGGFLGRLQELQQIRNQEANLVALRESLAQLEAAYEAGRIDLFQVEQARQALYNAESRLLSSRVAYQDQLDDLKITLGLPPELPVELDTGMLQPFELLDPTLTAMQDEMGRLLELLRTTDPEELEFLREVTTRIAVVMAETDERIEQADRDYEALLEVAPDRRRSLAELAATDEVRQGQLDGRLFSVELFNERLVRIKEDLGLIQRFLDESAEEILELVGLWRESPTPEVRLRLVESINEYNVALLELSLVQARARLDKIVLRGVKIQERDAILIAAANRRDWANARASVVDAWRLIEFNANALQSDLNVVIAGDVRSTGDRLFNLQGATGQLRMQLQWDAPTARVAERNVFRQSLIDFQEARRGYMQFTDQVKLGLRVTLRQINRDLLNFELRRSAIDLAIRQVDITQLRLNAPPRPQANGAAVGQFGGTTARDLLDALSDLLNVQNDFLSVYVNYQVQRMILDRDLGTMQLDPYGLWIDPGDFEYDLPLGAHTCLLHLPGFGGGADLINEPEDIFRDLDAEEVQPPVRAAPLPDEAPPQPLQDDTDDPRPAGSARRRGDATAGQPLLWWPTTSERTSEDRAATPLK